VRRTRATLLRSGLLLGGLLATGCTPTELPMCLPAPGAPVGPIAAAFVGRELRVRGFDDPATSSARLIETDTAAGTVEVSPDENGRFDTRLSGDSATLWIDGTEVPLRADDAGACIVAPDRFDAGTVPNDLVLVRCDGRLRAVVAASGDGALQLIDTASGDTQTVAFPVDATNRGANPWHVAARSPLAGESPLVAASLYGQHRVALVDACSGTLIATAAAADSAGDDVIVDVIPAAALSTPLDADGDGATETTVGRMRLRHPQGIALAGDVLLATYSNLLEAGPPARFGPGVLFRWRLQGDRLSPLGATILPFQNPQSISLDVAGRPWISASGVLELRDGRFTAITDGGLLRVNAESGAIEQTVALDNFAPGTPAFTADHAVVGSLTSAVLRVVTLSGDTPDAELKLGGAGVESIFEVASIAGGLTVAAVFGTDQLHVIDPRGPTLHPWPFTAPIALGTADLARGAQAIAIAPPRSDTSADPEADAFALLGLSSELVPLRFWQGVGP